MSKNENYDFIGSFYNAHYQQHNIARLQHLESLGLDLTSKSVLEFGAGSGDHTVFYLFKNCNILPTDGRKEHVEFIEWRLGIKGLVIDAEKDKDVIESLPIFDIIHCYGFLYHINNPGEFLDLIKDKANLLLLETCVSSDKKEEGICFVSEAAESPTQSISGTGCRPTRSWIFKKLARNYRYVYCPKTQPKHDEFPIDWNRDYDENLLIRAVFIASKNEIKSPVLSEEMPIKYEPW